MISVADKGAKHFSSEEVIQLCILDLKRKPHTQIAFLSGKIPQFCQNHYALHFYFAWEVPEDKKG